MELPKKVKNKPLYDSKPTLEIYAKKLKLGSQRAICTSMFTTALFTIVKTWKQSKVPSKINA